MNEKDFQTRHARSEEDVVQFYDQYAETWDARFESCPATRRFLEKRWQSFQDVLGGDGQEAAALELGVGTGAYIDRASRVFRHITAVDGSPRMLDQLRRKLDAAGIRNVSALEANVLSMPAVDSASMDVAYFFGLLEHILHPDAFARELRRVLRPGGLVIGVTPNRRCPWYALRRLVRGTGKHCSSDRYYSAGELAALFTSCGFAREAMTFWGAVPAGLRNPVLYAALRLVERVLEGTPLSRFLGGITFRFRKPPLTAVADPLC